MRWSHRWPASRSSGSNSPSILKTIQPAPHRARRCTSRFRMTAWRLPSVQIPTLYRRCATEDGPLSCRVAPCPVDLLAARLGGMSGTLDPRHLSGGEMAKPGELPRTLPSLAALPPAGTRASILDAANRLFAEQGYDATSLRQIAD